MPISRRRPAAINKFKRTEKVKHIVGRFKNHALLPLLAANQPQFCDATTDQELLTQLDKLPLLVLWNRDIGDGKTAPDTTINPRVLDKALASYIDQEEDPTLYAAVKREVVMLIWRKVIAQAEITAHLAKDAQEYDAVEALMEDDTPADAIAEPFDPTLAAS